MIDGDINENLVTADALGKFFSVKPSTIRYWTTTGVIPTEAVVKITPKVVRYDFNKVKAALYKPEKRPIHKLNELIHGTEEKETEEKEIEEKEIEEKEIEEKETEEKEIEVEKPKKTLVGDIQTQIDYLKQLNEEK
tara:strand:+ start:1403 stop:1810 length:408 start_codon:yes stop_codon:yes gene_type:complete